jgi:predicted transcriptional regulator
MSETSDRLITQTVDIVSSYVSKNPIPVSDLPRLISSVHTALAGLGGQAVSGPAEVEKLTTAQMKKSITHDALISFEDGKPYKTLRRHLTLRGLSPEAYRAKWGLPIDYPMTAQAGPRRGDAGPSPRLGVRGDRVRVDIRCAPEYLGPTA